MIEDSNLVKHAKAELELLGEEKSAIEGYLETIRIFSNMGHSGGSASVFIPTLMKLLNFENLTPLHTVHENKDEWYEHEAHDTKPFWQNKRNSAIFTNDGESYWNVNHQKPLSFFDNPNDAVLSKEG